MAIRFSCGSCGKRLAVREENAGRRSKCPGCGGELVVPELVASMATVEPIALAGAEVDGLAGPASAPPPVPMAAAEAEEEPVAIPIPPTSPSPSPSPRTAAPARPSLPGAGFRAFLIILSIIFILAGLGASHGSSFYARSYSHRFATDNAVGATANALEFLAEHARPEGSAGWFTLALLCWLIASVERLRYTVEIGMRRAPGDRG